VTRREVEEFVPAAMGILSGTSSRSAPKRRTWPTLGLGVGPFASNHSLAASVNLQLDSTLFAHSAGNPATPGSISEALRLICMKFAS